MKNDTEARRTSGRRALRVVGAGMGVGLFASVILLNGWSSAASGRAARGTAAATNHDLGAPGNIAKAKCGPGSNAERALQGQVPQALRKRGFKGHSCNLERVGTASSADDSGAGQFALVHDRAGHVCGYQGSNGTTVVDLTDPVSPRVTAILKTPGMIRTGEGLRANQARGLLVGNYYNSLVSGGGSDEVYGFDVYDVGADCRQPRLLSSTTQLSFRTTGLSSVGGPVERITGHEGNISADGKTYWISDFNHGVTHAIDLSDPGDPKVLASFSTPEALRGLSSTHGLSISTDGNRAYAATFAPWPDDGIPFTSLVPSTGEYHDGFMILDTSEVQSRKPNPVIRLISETNWHDNVWAHGGIPARIKGRQYVITRSEGGSGGASPSGLRLACSAKRSLFGMPKIYDASNEAKPRLVSKLVLEVNDPNNCSAIDPEIAALPAIGSLVYDVHMCSVDNKDDATTLACSFSNGGIRVFDIRKPSRPTEIAYYNPPASKPGTINWCGANPILDAAKGMIYTSCSEVGVFALRFTNGVWPFPGTKTPPDRQL
jgi:hypothetical protein